MYEALQENTHIDTKVFYRIGEHIIFEEKKYSIFSISISAEKMDAQKVSELKILAESNNFYVETSKALTINIPMITLD